MGQQHKFGIIEASVFLLVCALLFSSFNQLMYRYNLQMWVQDDKAEIERILFALGAKTKELGLLPRPEAQWSNSGQLDGWCRGVVPRNVLEAARIYGYKNYYYEVHKGLLETPLQEIKQCSGEVIIIKTKYNRKALTLAEFEGNYMRYSRVSKDGFKIEIAADGNKNANKLSAVKRNNVKFRGKADDE